MNGAFLTPDSLAAADAGTFFLSLGFQRLMFSVGDPGEARIPDSGTN